MPGKGDFGADNTEGCYYPGSKEWRAWSEGHGRRFADGGLSKPNTVHASGTKEFDADQAGWDRANTQLAGQQQMPANRGAPS